ncbi:serine hydrolase domain-containing protein [Streptomyces humicola]|uniref:serine hydrolase domain-containing protein n=1 Tax=Streptomyces humicola TaxID=2953240 RepID=UPI0027E30BD9|nr:serine hydrolase domain-containing protein [Streptomyces humicola]
MTDHLALLLRELAAALEPPAPLRPWAAGAVVLAGRGPDVALHEALGWAVRYAAYDETCDRGVELPREQWVPMRRETVFDLASLTKLFTAIVAVQQIERGRIALDGRVAGYLPEFGGAGKEGVTVRQLLAHTSGLRAELPFYDQPSHETRLRLLWDEALLQPPGTAYGYSDLNLIATQLVLERVTGAPLAALVQDGITRPLGMADTCFNPPRRLIARIAATEDQRRPWGRLDRGMVHGDVHDENAYAMGGAAGHAGLFSTAADLGVLCRALLAGGGGILGPESVALMFADAGPLGRPRGLGFDLDQPSFMGELAGPRTAGHTGFTGTSLVIDPESASYLILLANAVHPTRLWREGQQMQQGSGVRAATATRLARWVKSLQ